MDEVATKIIDILKKHMKEPRDDIDTSTELTALEIESLDLAMIVFDIEDTFSVEIPYNANEDAGDARQRVKRGLGRAMFVHHAKECRHANPA